MRIGGIDNPAPRGGELQNPCSHFGLQAGIRDRHPCSRRDGLDQSLVFEHRLVVDEDGDRLPIASERGDCPPRPGFRELDRKTCVVDVASLLREPVTEDEGAVAERAPELVPQGPRVGLLPEVDDQVGYDSLGPAAAEEIDEEDDG